jgi:hypothetical protein
MQTFDPLTFLEHIWSESGSAITLLFLIILGGLLVWVGFKKLI